VAIFWIFGLVRFPVPLIVPHGQVTGLMPVLLSGVTKVTLFLKLVFLLFPEYPFYQFVPNKNDDDDEPPGARVDS
jgi:hypothetical protein